MWTKVGGWKAAAATMFVVAAVLGVACTLNPQPLPPGAAAETGGADASAADARGGFGNDADGAGGGGDAGPVPQDAASDAPPLASDAGDAGDAGDADVSDAESDAPVDAGGGG